MAKVKINEKAVEYLQSQIDQCKKEKQWALNESDSLRADNSMLLEILTDMTEDDSYWKDDPQTQTMRWRVKNLIKNLKKG